MCDDKMMTQNVIHVRGEEEIMIYDDGGCLFSFSHTTTTKQQPNEYHGLSSVDSIYRNNLASSIHTVSHSHNKKNPIIYKSIHLYNPQKFYRFFFLKYTIGFENSK